MWKIFKSSQRKVLDYNDCQTYTAYTVIYYHQPTIIAEPCTKMLDFKAGDAIQDEIVNNNMIHRKITYPQHNAIPLET